MEPSQGDSRTPAKDGAENRVGPYRLISRIGEGGMGVVHRAADDAGQEVALKLLRPELADDMSFQRRLVREVDVLRRVRSSYVAEIVDAAVSADPPYIATRFIDGQPLDQTVRATGPLPGRLLTRLAAGLAQALVAIHRAGIVHRDLKPANVMLVEGTPVVIDFGIAHMIDSTRLTQTGMIVGTPGYLAPEVIDGHQPGPAVDVFAWAATLAYAATGRSPFGSGTLESVLARVVSGRSDLEGVPQRFAPFLSAALHRDPGRRPSAGQLVDWLRELEAAESASPEGAALGRTMMTPGTTGMTGMTGMQPPAPVPMSPVPVNPPQAGPMPLGRAPMPAHPVPAPAPPRVGLGWYKLVAYLVIVATVASVAVLPTLGAAAVVTVTWYLRAGDSAMRSRRVPVRGARDLLLVPFRVPGTAGKSGVLLTPSVVYAGAAAGLTALVLLVLRATGRDIGAGVVGQGSAAVFAYMMLAGPGIMAPRRQLVRLVSAVAQGRRAAAWAGLAMAGVAALAVGAAWRSMPHWWPMTEPYGPLRWVADRIADLLARP